MMGYSSAEVGRTQLPFVRVRCHVSIDSKQTGSPFHVSHKCFYKRHSHKSVAITVKTTQDNILIVYGCTYNACISLADRQAWCENSCLIDYVGETSFPHIDTGGVFS